MPGLAELIGRSREYAAENVAARGRERRDDAAHSLAWAGLLPSFSATGSYVRNQYEAAARIPLPDGTTQSVVITPTNLFTATLELNVPIFDYPKYADISAASASRRATVADVAASEIEVAERVSVAYYGLLGGLALEQSSVKALSVAEENLQVVSVRQGSGLASELDVARARTAVAERQQDLAAAELTTQQAARSLETLTGVRVERARASTDWAQIELASASSSNPPLDYWLAGVERLPAVRSAAHRLRASQAREGSAVGSYVPSINGVATETFNNAAGFGNSPFWTVGVSALWRLDLGLPASVGQAKAATAVAAAEQLAAARQASERIATEWDQVQSELVRVRAAQAQQSSSEAAARVAKVRYEAGTATQLDVLTANRDALVADVGLIRARVELARSRTTLQLVSGRFAGLADADAGLHHEAE